MNEPIITTKIVGDSINSFGDRITSFLLTYPLIVHSELMTHRIFSRNAASNRAIPIERILETVAKNPFLPIWTEAKKGMQGDRIVDKNLIEELNKETLEYLNHTIKFVKYLNDKKIHKQNVNRFLNPFQYITTLVTATDFQNFFALRCHPDAEIHIQDLAYKMLEEYNKSIPKLLTSSEWHMPFGDDIDADKIRLLHYGKLESTTNIEALYLDSRIKIATARCARTSYTTLDTQLKHDYEKDIELHDRLLNSGHFSPFEHCAKCMSEEEHRDYVNGKMEWTNFDWAADYKYMPKENQGWCGNFRGFVQYRKTLSNEWKKDSRVQSKQINVHN